MVAGRYRPARIVSGICKLTLFRGAKSSTFCLLHTHTTILLLFNNSIIDVGVRNTVNTNSQTLLFAGIFLFLFLCVWLFCGVLGYFSYVNVYVLLFCFGWFVIGFWVLLWLFAPAGLM